MARIRYAPAIAACMLWTTATLFAQAEFPYNVDTRPRRGFLPDSMTGAVDSVNPVSGSLHLNIPIVSLPEGPGPGFTLSLTYSSSLYDITPGLEGDLQSGLEFYQTLTTAPGWSLSVDNYRVEEEFHVLLQLDYGDLQWLCESAEYKPRFSRPRIGLGDGSLHALHLQGYGYQAPGDYDGEGFYHFDLGGNPLCTEPYYPQPGYLSAPRWFTHDGTFMKFDSNTSSGGLLHLRDGSQVDFDWGDATAIRDPNGNPVDIVRGCSGTPCVPYVAIRDAYWETGSDRQILIEFVNDTPAYTRITGPTGAVWKVYRDTIEVPAGDKEYEESYEEFVALGARNHSVVTEIEFPTSPATSYTFGYNDGADGWGELDQMTAPSGAVYDYVYQNLELRREFALTQNRITSREVTHGSESDIWTYDYSVSNQTTVTNPDSGETTHYINASDRVSKIGGENGSIVERVFAFNGAPREEHGNIYVKKELVTVGDDTGQPAKTAITEFEYDRNGNMLSRVEYDWVNYGTTTGSTTLRTTEYDYYFPSPEIPQSPGNTESEYGYWREHHASYWSGDEDPRRLNAVQRITVSESGSTPVAISEFEYDDEYGTGNVTAGEYWDSELAGTPPSLGSLSATNSQVVTKTWNSLGQLTEIDGDAVNTEITYGTIPGGSGPGPYPTQVVYAPGTAIARTFSYAWDYETGLLDTETDEDNDVDTEYTYDGLGRIRIVEENGLRQTETIYDDDDLLVRVESDLLTLGDGKLQSVTHYDELGRVVLTRVTDGAALSTSPTATDGIKVSTTYIPASGGNRVVTSTPYRTTSDPTLEWSCTQYDLLGRVTAAAMFTGSTAPTTCSSTTNRTGIAYVTYDADRTETTDPAGKVREEYRDGLGRLVTVTEDPGGSLDSDTDYTYDPLGNLLTVDQGTQTRTFEYSSLGRLLEAVNPENGTVAYTYNPDGSLDTVTDARSLEISYTYDVLGRITAKNYSDSTPDVTYAYYTSGAPKIGALQSVTSSVATETFTSYDILGRVLAHTQEIAGNSNDYTLEYTYRLDDSVATITYPSGREVDYTADNAGRVRGVSEGSTVYADLDNATGDYDPLGRMARIELGNGLWEARDYRPAGTATALKLGTSSGGSERLQLQYNYSGTQNNGNLSGHVVTHPGPTTYTQSFTYDAVNRLATASETSGFSRTYGYDVYGNRWVASSSGVYHSDSHEPASSSNFSTSTNRLSVASSTYDSAGNQTYFAPYTLTVDAENRLTEAESASNGNAYYAYDGDGRRVAKSWTPNGGSEVLTYYVYDIAGRLAAEYSDGDPGDPGRSYLFTDLLGSVRAVTDDAGIVEECYDFLPFGRMLTSQDNGRSSAGCYPSSPATYTSDLGEKFTGQQRDEILLDYFIARYYSGGQGRFTGADLPFMDQWEEDPQSWNLYVYVRNNPFLFIDPTGRERACVIWSEPTAGTGGHCDTDETDFSSWDVPCGLDVYIDGIYSGVTCESGGDGLEGLHTALDIGGMTPVVGIFADLANSGIYLFQGELWNSGISLAGALPFGQIATGTRLARRGVNVYRSAAAARHSPGQRALKELVDEATMGGRRPLSRANAETVLDWADEVGYPGARAMPGDLASPSNWRANPVPHIHLPGAGRSGHVPVEFGVWAR